MTLDSILVLLYYNEISKSMRLWILRLYFSVGHAFVSYTYEPGIALPIMYDWLLKNGVIFNTKKLKCLEEVDGYDLVINSSGCGAKYLV